MADEVGLGLRGVAKLAEGERLLILEAWINTKETDPLRTGENNEKSSDHYTEL